MHSILAMLILIPTLVFWFPNPKSIFGEIWVKKVKVVQFGWKLTHMVSRRCWFLFRHYFSLFPTLNPFLDKLGREIQSCLFWLKIGTHGISRMLILIPTILFGIANPFFGKFGLKNSKLFLLPENCHTHTYTHSISKMLIVILILVFSNFKPKSWGCWFLFWD